MCECEATSVCTRVQEQQMGRRCALFCVSYECPQQRGLQSQAVSLVLLGHAQWGEYLGGRGPSSCQEHGCVPSLGKPLPLLSLIKDTGLSTGF